MTAATEERTERQTIIVAPWGIEADHPRNSDLLLQCLVGIRLRSAFDGSKPIKDRKTGDYMIPKDQAANLGSFPRTPGMQLHVNPAECTYAIIDPLYEDEELCERVKRFLTNHMGMSTTAKLKGVEPQKDKLDIHRMKSLNREMVQLVTIGHAKRVKGVVPDEDDIQRLPGHFLLNPGARVYNSQPTYEKDFEGWADRLAQSGM